mgnify:CR=1 FL=1
MRNYDYILFPAPILLMENTRLTGKDWLDSQGVAYRVMPVSSQTPMSEMSNVLGCTPTQLVVCDFYIGKRAPVIVVHSLSSRVNLELLCKHVGDSIERLGTNEECMKETGLSLMELHPFLENYWWKVLDEKLFQQEKVYIRAGNMNEVLEIEANALKYVIGVVNGLLAEVTQ